MDKRSFLKLSSAAVAGTAFTNLISCSPDKSSNMSSVKNWAGNLLYQSSKVVSPSTIEEVQEIVRSNSKLRVLGTRHCFNTIADTNSLQLSTAQLNKLIKIDQDNWTVTVEAGIRYGEFCELLHEAGFAIHNLASLPHISVAGACATATHGSGIKNGNLATNISGIEFIDANGNLVEINRAKDPELLNAVVVNMGSIGVVTKLTLDLIPTFQVRQDVYLNLPAASLENNFIEIMSGGYSVSLFTDWQTDNINQVWRKSVVREGEKIDIPKEYFGSALAYKNVHPIIDISAENCTEQMGVPGPWYNRLPHFKMGFMPSSGEELQAEYFVPVEHALEAIKAISKLRNEIAPYILITEIRSIAADNLWMSPCYKQDSIAIHFTLKQDIEGVNKLLPKIEEQLKPFQPKPHWGKLFTIPSPELESRYSKLEDFKLVMKQYDPNGKFRNQFIDQNLFNA